MYHLFSGITMEQVDNNQFEIKPNPNSKRKLPTTLTNVYLNPALDLLVNDDPMCNNKMEIIPKKKRKRTTSCDIAAFENSALDLGISKKAVNEFLARELENVKKNLRNYESNVKGSTSYEALNNNNSDPIYANFNSSDPCLAIPRYNNIENPQNSFTNKALMVVPVVPDNNVSIADVEMDSGISILEHKSLNPSVTFDSEISAIEPVNIVKDKDIVKNNNEQIKMNNQTNLSLSFIDRLGLDSPNLSNQSLYLDDDLNESNIMEIKTITIITKRKRVPEKKCTNPFLNQSFDENVLGGSEVNPFLNLNKASGNMELTYNPLTEDTMHPQTANAMMPRRLFTNDVNSTNSTVNESLSKPIENVYENIDNYRAESPIYENVCEEVTPESNFNKQSKILGQDVSLFSAVDIMNLNKNRSQGNSSNDSNDSKKDFKHNILKVGKKMLKKVKKTFKSEKVDNNVTLNPYEVPRKMPKQKTIPKDEGIENPALNLDNTDEIDIEELDYDEEHQYETVKTIRNTQLNTNVTPLKERVKDNFDYSINRVSTPGKKQVRFDSTLNQEKIITGDSFEFDVQSPGFDSKIEKYHDELENCINERKYIQQNM